MKLSIIIAAYNVEKFIEKCILSCIRQDLDASLYEIIVVDDGSSDRTSDKLSILQSRHANIIVVDQPNLGLGSARNKGLELSRGDFVWFIDGDDYIQENILNEITDRIFNAGLEALVLNYAIADEQGDILSQKPNKLQNINAVVSGAAFYESNYALSYTWLFVFKRALFLENKIRFKERINMQDSEIMPKLMLNIHRLAFFDRSCYYYVQHADSFTNSQSGLTRYQYFKSVIEVRDSLLEFLAGMGENDFQLSRGIEKKLESLHEVVFNHLVFFTYEEKWFKKVIDLLTENQFYPLSYKPKGKMRLVKLGMNFQPFLAKRIIDLICKKRNSN